MTKKRVIAYYDASNFYHRCRDHYGIIDIDFFHMSNNLLKLDSEELIKIKYFTCPKSQQEDHLEYAKQQRFFAKLRTTPLIDPLHFGKLVKRFLQKINVNCSKCDHQQADVLKCPKCNKEIRIKDCFKYLEKGVDVRLSTNLLLDALHDRYDVALLFSSDGDYSPAIEHIVKELKKEVIYCHFPSPTSELLCCCSEHRLITKDILEKSRLSQN